jgi:GxxExxY protein
MPKRDLAKSEVTGRILKCAIEVHKTLGPGFQEVVYQRALAKELEAEGLATREEWVPIFYKGEKLDTRRVDFIVEDVLVEIKAKAGLEEADFIQTPLVLEGFWIQSRAAPELWRQAPAGQTVDIWVESRKARE